MRAVTGTDWNYEDQDEWGDYCNTGIRQSPLDFDEVSLTSYGDFQFWNYRLINTTLEIKDHHLEVKLVPLSQERPHILGGGLVGKYVLDSFHIHGGTESGEGSEHRLLGCSFTGEIHFVHYKDTYGSVEEAREHEDGVAVLAVWLTAATGDNDEAFSLLEDGGDDKESEKFHAASTAYWLLELIPKGPFVPHSPGRTSLRHILPSNDNNFYRYWGSLTTPPCSPTVVWTVFRDPVNVPARLINFLRSLNLGENFRDIQGQDERIVYFSGHPGRHVDECDDGDDK
ncbi:hypothetical protein O3P69_009401 [Scylla paramamosain]|uniref:Carbonic anhydrase n=1 Tax=Scylla paramamosain TaxID=85552 RepID=A0AAW0STL8_SCYPA